jgi:hypothetical protein
MNDTYDEFKRKVKKRDWVRLAVIIFGIISVTGWVIYSAIGELGRTGNYLFIGIAVVFYTVVLVVYVIYPLAKPLDRPVVEDREVIDLSEEYPQDEYYEVLHYKLMHIVSPFVMAIFASFAIWGLVEGGELYLLTIVHGSLFAFYTLVFVSLRRIKITGTPKGLRVRFGPIRTKIQFSDIVSARPTVINPWKTYLGFGWRIGSDGSIGYITEVRTGIRLEIKGRRRNYVISSHQPQVLVNYIRKMKKVEEKP